MAHNARTRPLAAANGAASAQPTPPAAPAAATTVADQGALGGMDRILEGLWHLLTSMKVALVLILIFAGLSMIGTLVIQAPPGVLGDPQAKADWIDSIRPKYGGWTGIMDQLQLFEIFGSIWFKVVVGALSISLVACSVHRVTGLWHTATRPHISVGERFFEHAPQHEVIQLHQGAEAAETQVRETFRHHRYRLLAEDDGTVHLYMDKNRWAPLFSLVGHLSLLLIVIGAIVGGALGYRDGNFMLAEGASAAVPTVEGATIKLEAFRDSYYAETGAPADYASDVVVYQDGTEVMRQTIRVNDPLRYEGMTFYQAFYGTAAAMSVADAGGTVVFEEGVPLAWSTDDGARRVGTFVLPSAGLTVWVVGTAGPNDPVVKPGQMRVEVYQSSGSGTPVASETIDQGKSAEIAGLTFTFGRETQFTGLSASKDPGAPLVWIGSILLLVGFTVVFMFPHRRVWGRIVTRPGGSTVSLAAAGRKETIAGKEFTDIVNDVRRAFSVPAKA